MDRRVIEARLRKLNAYVTALRRHQGVALGEYLGDEDLQAIVERRLQLAIRVCLDIANYIIAEQRLEAPEGQENVFLALAGRKVVPLDLAERIKAWTRFRSILVHDYLDIDHRLVHHKLAQQLSDFEAFARAIVAWLNRRADNRQD